MDHQWPVTVVDDNGGAVVGARVCLVEASAVGAEYFPFPALAATHDDKGGGTYEPKAPIAGSAGDWMLVVSLKDKAPVLQPLTLKKKVDEFIASVRKGAVATVTFTGTLRTVGTSKVKETAFKVVLHPAAELIFLGGVDYSKRNPSTGWMFHLYGFYRAEVLWREKKIHAGTVVTVFSLAKITRTTRVRGGKGWVDVEVVQIADPASRTLPPAGNVYVPVVGIDIHITDFYKYLAEVGKRAPKSVKEVGIFSHSYPGGAILYNSSENSIVEGDYRSRAERNPSDFDARVKDFNAINFPAYADMKNAFTADCRWTIWGCSATTHYKNRSRKSLESINKGMAETDFFVVDTAYYDDHSTPPILIATQQERTSEIRHRWRMDTLFRRNTYPAVAAAKLGIEVRSACPGVGSDPHPVEGIEMLMVDLAVYKPVYDYFHLKFSPEFSETTGKWDKGYVDYHALQGRAAVAVPPFDHRWYELNVQMVATRWKSIGAEITFWNGKTILHPTPNVTVKPQTVPDLVTAGKTGELYVLQDLDKTKSQAIYVCEDGQVNQITQDATHQWTVVGTVL